MISASILILGSDVEVDIPTLVHRSIYHVNFDNFPVGIKIRIIQLVRTKSQLLPFSMTLLTILIVKKHPKRGNRNKLAKLEDEFAKGWKVTIF